MWEAVGIFLILFAASGVLGASEGKNVVTGGCGSSEIEFKLTDANISALNETLILVLYANDIYYVVEKCVPAPQSPRLHMIKKEQIESADIKLVTARNTPFYENWAYTLVDFWRGNAIQAKRQDREDAGG